VLHLRITYFSIRVDRYDASTRPVRHQREDHSYGIGTGPSNASLNLRVSKVIGIGPKVESGRACKAGGGGGGGGGGRGEGAGHWSRWPERQPWRARALDLEHVAQVQPDLTAYATNLLNIRT